MIAIVPTDDLAFVRDVFTHPKVWPYICDDFTADPVNFQPPAHHAYLVPTKDGVPMGCFSLNECNGVTVELHTAILPEFRGQGTADAFVSLFDFIRIHIPGVRRLRTWVPDCNKAALAAAPKVGLTHCGTEAASFLRHGELHDLHLYGVSFPCP